MSKFDFWSFQGVWRAGTSQKWVWSGPEPSPKPPTHLGEQILLISWLRFQFWHLQAPNLTTNDIFGLWRPSGHSIFIILKPITSSSSPLTSPWSHFIHSWNLPSSNFYPSAGQLPSIKDISPIASLSLVLANFNRRISFTRSLQISDVLGW